MRNINNIFYILPDKLHVQCEEIRLILDKILLNQKNSQILRNNVCLEMDNKYLINPNPQLQIQCIISDKHLHSTITIDCCIPTLYENAA